MTNDFLQKLQDHTDSVHQEFGQPVIFISPELGEDISNFYATPFQRTRDAKALEISNFEVISKDLSEKFPDDIEIHNFRHWAVGWIDRVYVRRSSDAAIQEVRRWVEALENYPIANEEHYSQTEWDENHPTDSECYSEQGQECPCRTTIELCVPNEQKTLLWSFPSTMVDMDELIEAITEATRYTQPDTIED